VRTRSVKAAVSSSFIRDMRDRAWGFRNHTHYYPVSCCSCRWDETCLWTAATDGPIVDSPGDTWVLRATVEWYGQDKTEELGEKPVSVYPVPSISCTCFFVLQLARDLLAQCLILYESLICSAEYTTCGSRCCVNGPKDSAHMPYLLCTNRTPWLHRIVSIRVGCRLLGCGVW
jgi:hypothetical protein